MIGLPDYHQLTSITINFCIMLLI